MTVAAILEAKGTAVVTARVDQPVGEVLALLAERRIGALPVMDGETVAGVLSERDIIYGLNERGAEILKLRAGAVMTAPAITVAREQTALNALAMMTRRRIRHLPVVENGRLIGLVSIGDLVARRINRIEHEAAAMREYIAGA